MGVETPIPPKMIHAAAPDGAPPRRIRTVEIIISRFSWLEYEPDRFILVSPEAEIYFEYVPVSDENSINTTIDRTRVKG